MKNSLIYPEMIESAKLVPHGENTKLVIRHSKRRSLKGVEFQLRDKVPLTSEGIDMAINFGKNLCNPIGVVYSSYALRCVQTVRSIIEGAGDSIEYPISLVDMVQFMTYDIQQLRETMFAEKQNGKNGKDVITKLLKGISLPGFYTIRDIALNQLNLVFSTGGQPSHCDIYCTHDYQLMCLISAIFKNIDNIDEVNSNWPRMLEGVFLWGNINNFYCVWRKNIRHVVNQQF